MKILILHNNYLGFGGEDVTVNSEVRLLKENGVKVSLLYFDNRNIGFTLFGKRLVLNPLKFIFNIGSYHRVVTEIERFRPDLIHIHNFWYHASPSIFYAANKMKVPTVVTLHNFRMSCINGLFYRNGKICTLCKSKKLAFHGIIYRCFQNSHLNSLVLAIAIFIHNSFKTWAIVSRYIVFTDFHKQMLLDSGLNIPSNRIVIKQNFLFLEEPSNSIDRNNTLLFVGRLSSEKGIDLLVSLIEKDLFNIEVIGTGPFEKRFLELQDKFSNFKFFGFREKAFILNKMRSSRALLFLSNWYEGGTPLSILESFSQGLPVICSDLPNLNAIVKHDVTGKLFNSGDFLSLCNAISNLINEKNASLSLNCLKEFNEKYSSYINFKKLFNIYQTSINEYSKDN